MRMESSGGPQIVENISKEHQQNNPQNHTVNQLVDNPSSPSSQVESDWKSVSQRLLGSLKYQIFITILTLYSLFSDDIRTGFFSHQVDLVFDIASLIVMIFFIVEIILSTLVVEDYFLSFFFFLDIVSTVSIIFDINFISDLIFATGNSSSVAQLASQSKASRAATRAVRIVKLFRIIRIIKLYKNSQKAKEIKEEHRKKQLLKEKKDKKKREDKKRQAQLPSLRQKPSSAVQNSQNLMANDGNVNDVRQVYPEENIPDNVAEVEDETASLNELNLDAEQIVSAGKKQSKIGKILSELSIKKIIIVVLLMMFIIPLFSVDLFRDPENVWDNLLVNQDKLLNQNSSTITTASIINLAQTQINSFSEVQFDDSFIIQYTTPFNEFPYIDNVDLDDLRNQDLLSSSQNINSSAILALRSGLSLRSSNSSSLTSLNVILNQNSYNRKLAYFSLGKTLFICLFLFILMHGFYKSIDTLLVQPIEEMMGKLMIIAKDPEAAVKESLNADLELQTTIISNAIIKIGILLSTVFGSAGAQIIGTNIIGEGEMNPMLGGQKKCAFFGFCDIRQFTQITEVLEEEILLFVNKIGSLVHESVYSYGGSANKNIGEAFLLVWKIPQEKYALDHATNQIDWLDKKYLSVLADFSLLGFVKTLIKLHKDPLMKEYGEDPRLKSVFGGNKVSMGFGLHAGWAIEGAIGSEYKIDASYLSPNVNMAARLEAATRQFGVDFLLSEDLYNLLTEEMKGFCRNIDKVTVKGSEKPISLYTVDLCYDRLTFEDAIVKSHINDQNSIQSEDENAILSPEDKREENMIYLQQDELSNYSAKNFIAENKQFREAMVDSLPESFKRSFELGITNYLKGKWADARLHLCQALKYRNHDGPTKTILSYMKKNGFNPPNDWKQYRVLTSK